MYALEKSNESWQWDETYQSYTLGNEKKNNNWYGTVGTLTMNIKEKKIYFNFDKFTLNMMGSIYIGPNNPKKLDGTDDYSREPQDLADAAARAHDKGYDKVRATGVYGATIDKKTIEADIQLVRGSRKIEKMFSRNEIDPYTLNPISKETFVRASKINSLFTLLVRSKILEANKKVTPEQQRLLNKLDNFIDLSIDDIINPVNESGVKFKLF
jgi:hypothetical protein